MTGDTAFKMDLRPVGNLTSPPTEPSLQRHRPYVVDALLIVDGEAAHRYYAFHSPVLAEIFVAVVQRDWQVPMRRMQLHLDHQYHPVTHYVA